MSETLTKEVAKMSKIAKDMTPGILHIISQSIGCAAQELAEPLCKAITVYGCRNQIAIAKTVTEINPLFREISDQYFKLMSEAVNISMEIDSKNYDAILSAILNDPDADIETKTALAKEIIAVTKRNNRENIKVVITATGKIVLGVSAIIGCTIGGVAYIGYKKAEARANAKTDNTEVVMEGIRNIVQDLNPIKIISDTVKTISDNQVMREENYYKYRSGQYIDKK